MAAFVLQWQSFDKLQQRPFLLWAPKAFCDLPLITTPLDLVIMFTCISHQTINFSRSKTIYTQFIFENHKHW